MAGEELATNNGRRENQRGNSRQVALGLKDVSVKPVEGEFIGRF